jgi:hypothetical protein
VGQKEAFLALVEERRGWGGEISAFKLEKKEVFASYRIICPFFHRDGPFSNLALSYEMRRYPQGRPVNSVLRSTKAQVLRSVLLVGPTPPC